MKSKKIKKKIERMSNKKRIYRRISQIEKKKVLNFYFCLDKAAKTAEKTVVSLGMIANGFFSMMKSMNVIADRMDREIKIYPEHQMGVDFADYLITTQEGLSFINDVRSLTGVDDMESKIILTKMPEHTKIPLLELLKVGYNLNDAYDLIKDTFKF